MRRIAKTLLYITMLFVFSRPIAASESNRISIKVKVFPPQAQFDSTKTNWTVELQLIRKTTAQEPNGSTVIIDEQVVKHYERTASNNGIVGWLAPVRKHEESDKQEQIRYYYKVVCSGRWVYNDDSSKELDAEIPKMYNMDFYMKRKVSDLADLNPVERAKAYQNLVETFGPIQEQARHDNNWILFAR
jgi:hypothetical protein